MLNSTYSQHRAVVIYLYFMYFYDIMIIIIIIIISSSSSSSSTSSSSIKNEKIRVTLCENAAGALYIVNKMCVDGREMYKGETS